MRFVIALAAVLLAAQAPPTPPLYHLTPDERRQIEGKIGELQAALQPLRGRVADELLVDAEVYLKAAQWIARFDEFYSKASVDQTLAAIDTGLERARQLAANDPRWIKRTGSFARAYRSRVDGSIQPYAITVPEQYDASHPEPLEVVLHGRGATLTEVSFLYAHDQAKPAPADHEFIQLDVFGRGNNAYRWAGETDVFEAIDSVKKRYKIDSQRIALRGFSMGGAGAWHIGLHYPDQWAVVEAGAGFVDTKVHASVASPPPYAHIYDAIDYAVNAVDVPFVGYGGEVDPQLRASTLVREELALEGYRFEKDGLNYNTADLQAIFLVGPKTPHRWHPDSKKQSDAFVSKYESIGIRQPSSLRFVTYTERYNRCFQITVDQLERQYERAEVDADMRELAMRVRTGNVARLTLRGVSPAKTFDLDGQSFPARASVTFEHVRGKWVPAAEPSGLRKIRGLQGPIDDAFMEPFLCVRPESGAGDSPVNDFALRQLDLFAFDFPRWMRGDVRVKTARELSPVDIGGQNIVLFGTPAANPMIARALEGTPIQWTPEAIVVGKRKFDAAKYLLSMIYPNPSNRAHYVVINSGHTFHEADFKGTNALLYPRVGDWAITDIHSGEVVADGVFDRNWQLP